MITFQAYTGETPTLQNGSDPFWLSGNSYISIKGLTFGDPFTTTWGRIDNGGNHNEIAFCTFTTSAGGGQALLITGALNKNWATHNWIHDNHFVVSGQANGIGGKGCTDGGGDVLDIGVSSGAYGNSVDNDNNNTVENNFFEHAPHANWDNYGMYSVFRNNVVHNEPWSPGCPQYANPPAYTTSNPNYATEQGMFAHRNFQITEDYQRTATYVLVEGNRSGYAGVNDTNDGADDFSLAAPQNIVRYNFFYASMNPGLMFKYSWGGVPSAGGNGGTYNRVYNNTFFQNGYGYSWVWPKSLGGSCPLSTCPWPQAAISLYSGSASGLGNVLKNNIFYQSAGYSHYGSDVIDKGSARNGWAEIGYAMNNWCSGAQSGGSADAHGNTGCSGSGNPQFNNPDLSNPASKVLPDLSLKSGSTAIDGGTFLTTATNAGTNSTTLTVADALYFQDGTWGSDLSRPAAGLGGTMQADWIAVGTVNNIVRIGSVTYGTYNNPAGTITLASPMTWSNGAHIWLYKKSDGAVVLAGAAPDYGASEYGAGGTVVTVAPPTSLQAVVQ
jgi:hypothetical protein